MSIHTQYIKDNNTKMIKSLIMSPVSTLSKSDDSIALNKSRFSDSLKIHLIKKQ